ncbi:MAG: tetraacyldisaccharide 4'-kinase [Nitrospirota bacterium]|nr:tetraacyldisaccharide 4'-kinase [Nitrospirota bacterium]
MYGRKSSRPIGALLFFLSMLYRSAVQLRLALYDRGFLRRKNLSFPVISVGNLTLGGTGKTPTVMAIADLLQQQGKAPVVLSRGYGRNKGPAVLTVSDRDRILVKADAAGDEPALMASQLKGVPVIVGKDRYAAGMAALSEFRPGVAVLDDGFQHIRLHRDLDILLVDGIRPFGNGKIFPAGTLREPVDSLKRADVVVITRAERSPDLNLLKEQIGAHTSAAVFTSRHIPTGLIDLTDDSSKPLSSIQGAAVLAFSGIARPDAFTALLQEQGADIRSAVTFPDHHRYSKNDVDRLRAQAVEVGATLIVTTEKDGIKLRDWDLKGFHALRIRLEVLEKNAWERVLLQRL